MYIYHYSISNVQCLPVSLGEFGPFPNLPSVAQLVWPTTPSLSPFCLTSALSLHSALLSTPSASGVPFHAIQLPVWDLLGHPLSSCNKVSESLSDGTRFYQKEIRWSERQGVTEEKEGVVTSYWMIRKDLAKTITTERCEIYECTDQLSW